MLDQPQVETVNLTNTKSSSSHRRLAWGIGIANMAIFALALPFGRATGPTIVPFLPAFLTAVLLFDILTAYLLFSQYRVNRRPGQLVLALTYFFTGMITIPHVLTFPGVFSPTGLMHAGSQTAVWLWVFWHSGYPTGILLSLWIEQRTAERTYTEAQTKRRALVLFPAVLLLVASITCLTIFGHDLLPVIIKKDNFMQLITSGVGVVVWVINAVALLFTFFLTRGNTVAQLWLIVAVFAMWLDVTLTLFSGSRFSVGWYVARLNSIISASIVLLGLLYEINRLYYKISRQDQRIKHQAYHDALTGLPNRALFTERLQTTMNEAQERGGQMALLFIDLDGFKQINDIYGHEHGDLLLIEVGQRLSKCVRAEDTVARMGGDEFTIILPSPERPEVAEAVAERVVEVLRQPFLINDRSLQVSSSVGISLFPEHGTDAMSLMKNADIAMYQAKEQGKNRSVWFQPSSDM